MISEAMMGASALKTAFDMAKALKDIDDRTRRNDAVIELQEKILGAQTAEAALIQQVGELEREVASLRAWEAEKQRYELQELPPGVFVRVLKPSMASGEPIHRLCAKCYEDGKKSILQCVGKNRGLDTLNCHGCGARVVVGVYQPPPPQNAHSSWVNSRRR
jgi:DNA polymerase IIIc chi subunit